MRTLVASLSIPIMVVVIVIMQRKRKAVIADNQTTLFLNMNLLYVVPTINQLVHDRLDTYNEDEMALYGHLLSNLNAYNMVLIFIYRQKNVFKEIAKTFISFYLPKKSITTIKIFENRVASNKVFEVINLS
uniref:G_PROTEIN_RECEP_F1_2 domain-containing protein n=1 Tax=Elaeophora elaphi TaxID=1147741 RepID=A0A0R3RNI6_9BILA